MQCTATGPIDSCGPKDATRLIPIDWKEKRRMMTQGFWPIWVAYWASQQIYQCRDSVAQWCDRNYWRPCT